MNSREKGFLLLTSHLGDPERRPLTTAQLRTLALRMETAGREAQERELWQEDLMTLGFDQGKAAQIMGLLGDTARLNAYMERGRAAGCTPVSRISAAYPMSLRRCLGMDAPGCLWMRGNLDLLKEPAVALVGSREIREENRAFAREVGRQAANQGFVLISGNARGADRIAQDSCLEAGGRVISIVADRLADRVPRENLLYISEDSYDLPFSSQRALSRNRLIHSMGAKTFVAQCSLWKGGTWNGTLRNLRGGWSRVFGFRDGSEASKELCRMGMELIEIADLHNIIAKNEEQIGLFD